METYSLLVAMETKKSHVAMETDLLPFNLYNIYFEWMKRGILLQIPQGYLHCPRIM